MNRKLAIYIHIPFCIQKCHYCDFATERLGVNSDIDSYVDLLCLEITKKAPLFLGFSASTIYFGGGTPSLLSLTQITKIISTLKNFVELNNVKEFTLEANPATIDANNLDELMGLGINRISLGTQTFNNKTLTALGREHSAESSLKTMSLLIQKKINYSVDLLYTLPHQTLLSLKNDLKIIKEFAPPHVSAYILTLAQEHTLNVGRPSDKKQVEMFYEVQNSLAEIGLEPYEISNYSRKGFESLHNKFYWEFNSYLGFGRSAHSFLFPYQNWGIRFWNPYSLHAYKDYILNLKQPTLSFHPENHFEILDKESCMTDFCYTHLRTKSGLNSLAFSSHFGSDNLENLRKKLNPHEKNLLLSYDDNTWRLTTQGSILSNVVFNDLLFK